MKYLFIFIISFLLTFKVSAQWIYQNTNIDGFNTAIFFTDSLTGYLGGNSYFSLDDYILKTTDGGSNWNEYPIIGNPTSLFFINSDTGFCSTNYEHHIYKTTNGGINWEINYSDNLPIWDVYFLNDSLGWAVGGAFETKGLILKTTDQGENWQRMLLPTMNSLRTIRMLNNFVGFIVGGNPSKIWKTENGGSKWYLILQDLSSSISFEYLNDIAFFDDLNGFAVGSKLFKTSDGGENWEELILPLFSYRSVFIQNNNCWLTASGFNYSHILYTSDYGLNWIPINSPIHSYNSFFINDSLGWFCGIDNYVLKTYSGGLTMINNPSIPNLVHPVQNEINVDIPVEFEWDKQNYCYFQIQVCNDSLFQTPIVDTTIVENKIFVDSSYLNPQTNNFWRVKSSNIIGISDWSNIRKFTTGRVLGIPDKINLPEFILKQNYPNPFNPETNISFSIKESGFVSLKVYDILGKEIASLVNERMEAGNYTKLFNASNLTSGVYIYSLRANDFSSFKKMIVVK